MALTCHLFLRYSASQEPRLKKCLFVFTLRRELGGTVDIESPPRAVVDNTFDLHHMFYVHASSFGGGELIRTWKPDPLTICFE